MKKFKKIYVEITNVCNLSCSFCPVDDNPKRHMSIDEFTIVINSIKDYTDYIYLHIKGEPLMNPNILDFLKICEKNKIFVNMTTNGTLLKKYYKDLTYLRQVNVSLQSIIDINTLSDIIIACDYLSKSTYISYRMWAHNNLESEILSYLTSHYNSLDNLPKNIFMSYDSEFVWPSLENEFISDQGSCKGLIEHIGILSNGDVVPCCLDSKGILKLGNIYDESLESILSSDLSTKMYDGFKKNKRVETLCQKCGF